jgi:hypothetical protein
MRMGLTLILNFVLFKGKYYFLDIFFYKDQYWGNNKRSFFCKLGKKIFNWHMTPLNFLKIVIRKEL